MFQVSGPAVAVGLVLSVVFAFCGYRLSENDRRTLGRTPWGLPSALWAVFWFLSIVVGLVLYLIAHANEVRRAEALGGGPGREVPTAASRAAPTVAEQFPVYPQPVNSAPPSEPVGPATVPPATASAPNASVPAASPPGWHPDPGGRFPYRWWDGTQWTSHVSVNGQVLVDTSPDQRIGPY